MERERTDNFDWANPYSWKQIVVRAENKTLVQLAHEYQEAYRLTVLPALSKGRQKIYGPWGEDRGWYDPTDDSKIGMIDAMYDLFAGLKARQSETKISPPLPEQMGDQ
jgi:hypothetical protein